MKPITLSELINTLKQLPDPATYKWQNVNIGDYRFHKNPAKDGWIVNNPVVVDEGIRVAVQSGQTMQDTKTKNTES